MAKDVVSSLRNGLAHAFDIKFVQVGPKPVELAMGFRSSSDASGQPLDEAATSPARVPAFPER
jgi:hypothetical protein